MCVGVIQGYEYVSEQMITRQEFYPLGIHDGMIPCFAMLNAIQ